MRIHVISDLVDFNAFAVFSNLDKVKEYLTSERKKAGSVLNQGAWISVFNLDEGRAIWQGAWEWVDGELKLTQRSYVYEDCVLCKKSRKVVDLDKYNRCLYCLEMEDDE